MRDLFQLCSLGISNSKLISGQSQLPLLSVTSVWWRCARRFTALPPSQHWAARAASLCARRLIPGQLGWLMAGNCARGAAGQLRAKLVPALSCTYKGMYVVTRWTYLCGLGFRIKRRLWKDFQILMDIGWLVGLLWARGGIAGRRGRSEQRPIRRDVLQAPPWRYSTLCN